MSCWVAPSIAADIWGLSLAEVVSLAERGEIQSQTAHGFFLVDLHRQPPLEPAPPTFIEMSSEELTALGEDLARSAAEPTLSEEPSPQFPADQSIVEPSSDILPSSQDEESVSIENWREVRRRTGRLRVPPSRRQPSAEAHIAA